MPPLTRWFVRASLVYFVVALGLSVAVAARPAGPPWLAALAPVYVHLFMVGWVTQLIAGVSLWLFPRSTVPAPRAERLGRAVFVALNAGLGVRAVAEPWQGLAPARLPAALLVASALLQWAGGLGYVAAVWPRVRAR
jgi:hypothetical protein